MVEGLLALVNSTTSPSCRQLRTRSLGSGQNASQEFGMDRAAAENLYVQSRGWTQKMLGFCSENDFPSAGGLLSCFALFSLDIFKKTCFPCLRALVRGFKEQVIMTQDASLPIGMFDSGVGGLTVLKALRERLPCEDVVYLGDTARLPYGTKSPQTVTRYGVQCGAELVRRNIKLLVVACNTVLGRGPETPCALPIRRFRSSVWSSPARALPARPRKTQATRGYRHRVHHCGRGLPAAIHATLPEARTRRPSLFPFRGPGRRRLDRRFRA